MLICRLIFYSYPRSTSGSSCVSNDLRSWHLPAHEVRSLKRYVVLLHRFIPLIRPGAFQVSFSYPMSSMLTFTSRTPVPRRMVRVSTNNPILQRPEVKVNDGVALGMGVKRFG